MRGRALYRALALAATLGVAACSQPQPHQAAPQPPVRTLRAEAAATEPRMIPVTVATILADAKSRKPYPDGTWIIATAGPEVMRTQVQGGWARVTYFVPEGTLEGGVCWRLETPPESLCAMTLWKRVQVGPLTPFTGR